MTSSRVVILVLVLAGSACVWPGPAFAPAQAPSIALEGVPSRLELPLPGGTNVLLTARIRGGPVRSVWLAREGHERARLLLTRVAEGEYQVNLADPAVAALLTVGGRAGSFRVFAEPAEGETVASVPVRFGPGPWGRQIAPLDPRPEQLELPGRTASFVLVQRRMIAIPGGRGHYRLWIGDITRGQTLVDLTAGREKRLESVSVRKGDRLTFVVGKRTYCLRVLALRNYLIGDDCGVFLVHDADLPAEEVRIESLIALVRHAEVDCVEDGRVVTPTELAGRLGQRAREWRPERRTLGGFIEAVTGGPEEAGIEVRRADRTTMPLRAWLESQAAGLDPAPARREV
ncbi:MAG: hypothetical protein JXQ29_12370 [Planctomycetes bacterium]|nr:hypothetical protein [Planctomycetota bacterium]